MTILIDASALVAMATHEIDASELAAKLDDDADRLCCSVGMWEAALAIARKRTVSACQAGEALDLLRTNLGIRVASVGEQEARLAIQAQDLYGRRSGHPAKLNMGDCFAYACAKANQAKLLYKGDDFSRTDLA